MNMVIKTLGVITLTMSAIFIWIACAIVGLMMSFTNLLFLSHFTPIFGCIGVICIINCGIRLVRSNPSEWIGNLFGKAKI
jgi:hypothetical protein